MEREEHTLRRKCEDLRLTLDSRTRELSQSQELYSKLKQRVLLSQNQEIPPSVSASRSPMQAAGSVDAGQGQAHSQLPRPVLPVGARTGVSNYFPASPGYSKPQPSSTAIVEWNKPVFTQRRCYSVGIHPKVLR
jgi:E3 ubiquitin-protein ligase CCNP1IP1